LWEVPTNVITEAQNGFRKNKSTDTASQTFIKSIQEALDKGTHAIGLFFALTKAYDLINHDILLGKLHSYGIRGVSNQWFKSYLSNRFQFVKVGDTDCSNPLRKSYTSSCMKVKPGVPQGSVLGLLLFLMYINDLTENV
jgi:hypothetical protein